MPIREAACPVVPLLALLLLATASAHAVTCNQFKRQSLTFTACRVDLKQEELRLYWQDDDHRPFQGFAALQSFLARQGRTLEFAMNAGMFRPDYSPAGLYVESGQVLRKLNRASGPGNFHQQPNGVFLVDADGARVMSTQEYADANPHPRFATQSGPLLVHAGQIPSTPLFRAGADSRYVRNGVCAPTPASVVFVISESAVTFPEFASFFRDGLGCRDALYLDGSVSSLYSRALNRSDSFRLIGPMLAVASGGPATR